MSMWCFTETGLQLELGCHCCIDREVEKLRPVSYATDIKAYAVSFAKTFAKEIGIEEFIEEKPLHW